VHPDPYAWSLDAETVVFVPALVAAYAIALRFLPAPRWRQVSFGIGALLIALAFTTPLESLSLHYLLSAHLLQNVVLAEWAPALCILGLPPALAATATRHPALKALTQPFVALPIWLAVYFAWHLPWTYDTALEHPGSLLHLEHLCYLAAGCLLWWPVIHDAPARLSAAAKAIYLFAAFVLISPLGLLLALLPHPVYDFYVRAPHLWSLSHLADQQVAGVTMAAEQAVVFFLVFARFLSIALRESE
jgi:putative membrane protein